MPYKDKKKELEYKKRWDAKHPGYHKRYYQDNRKKMGNQFSEYYKRNKVYLSSRHREWKLQNKYGISIADYEMLRNKQGGCCLICGRHETGLRYGLVIDHDHRTNIVRGLLCRICNGHLGWYEHHQDKVEEYLYG